MRNREFKTIKDYFLRITDDKIIGYRKTLDGKEVDHWPLMASWKKEIMQEHARVIAKGGDVLEIGFGMGLSATAIQEFGVNSHTIVEAHPEIAKKAREWAKDYKNVVIIEGMWNEVVDQLELGKYDGIMYDTDMDPYLRSFHRDWAFKLLKEGGILTSFNPTCVTKQIFYFPRNCEWAGPFSIPNRFSPDGPAEEYWLPYIKNVPRIPQIPPMLASMLPPPQQD